MKSRVYITIDTETSIGGAWTFSSCRPVSVSRCVFGEDGRRAYGIPLLIDELNRHGVKATFFCEMLAGYVLGEPEIAKVTDFILSRGQDLQLHAHPTFWHYHRYLQENPGGGNTRTAVRNDHFSEHNESDQALILGKGLDIFRRLTGRSPMAFRAGGYSGNRTTLRVLRKMGIGVDCSFNPVYARNSFPGEALEPNRLQSIEGVWELPVTVAKTQLPETNGFKPFEISSISNQEMETILNAAYEGGMEHVVAVFHSFSTIKATDFRYAKFRRNRVTIERFRELLDFLDRNSSRFSLSTIGELAADSALLGHPQNSVVPSLGLWNSTMRKAVQAANRWYWF